MPLIARKAMQEAPFGLSVYRKVPESLIQAGGLVASILHKGSDNLLNAYRCDVCVNTL
jgi:hypothetical protein